MTTSCPTRRSSYLRVRRAQAATVRAHQRLTLHRHRVGHFADANVMVLKIGGFHDASRGCAAWSCPNTAYDGSERSRRPTSCRSEEHTSELQSLMRISYAVFCLKKKKHTITT